MLDRISQDPARYIDLMELQYLCLAFGFAGKYQVQERGHEQLAEIQQDLYRKIRSHRGAPPARAVAALARPRDGAIRSSATCRGGWSARRRWRSRDRVHRLLHAAWPRCAAPVHAAAREDRPRRRFRSRVAAPVRGPDAEAAARPTRPRHRCASTSRAAGRKVTLLAPDLFASGSATVNPAHYQTLQRLAAALNQVPGRVLVGRAHRRSADSVASLSRQFRAVARARAQRGQGAAARDRESTRG